jgi:hypothetical protein
MEKAAIKRVLTEYFRCSLPICEAETAIARDPPEKIRPMTNVEAPKDDARSNG